MPRYFYHRSLIALGLLLLPLLARGFDNDISINEPDFNPENFLDLKAYEFRKTVEEEWQASSNGWRMAGGSLGLDESYIDSELKLHRALSSQFAVRIHHQHWVYYDRKPVQHPLLEIALRPSASAVTYSLLGSTAYDKRQAELGLAVTFGDREDNYLRLARLSVDHFYNAKNIYDDSYYERKPQTTLLESSYRIGDWQTRLSAETDKPLELITPSTSENFQYQGRQATLSQDYHYATQSILGLSFTGWQQDKALRDSSTDREQALEHLQLDLYWVRPLWMEYEFTLGTRLDRFKNRLRDLNDRTQGYDYLFETTQGYAILHHDYSGHAAWELGTYLGNTRELKEFPYNAANNEDDVSIQGKLRTSWEYHSADKRNRFDIHMTFNLDNLFNDPGDGAGMSFQSVF